MFSFRSASIWCCPLCALLACTALGALLAVTQSHPDTVMKVIGTPVIYAYYFIPSPWFIAYLVWTQTVLVGAWRHVDLDESHHRWLVIFNSVVLTYACYVTYWYATGQKFEGL